MNSKLMMDDYINHRGRMRSSKKPGLAALLIATILLASCPMPDPAPTAPAAPENLTFTATETTVTLSWTAVTGAESYRVYRDGDRTGPDITALTYTDTGLTTAIEYTYTVRAVKDNLESGNSNEVAAISLAVPGGLTATVVAGNTVMLSWTEVTGATSYHVFRNGSETPIETSEPITGTSYTDTDIVRGSAYSYTVRAVKGSFASLPSVTATANPPTLPPENLMATPGDEQVELRWEAAEGAVTYSVYRSDETAPTTVPIETDITGLTYTDSPINNGVLYTYTVRSVGSNGVESGDSNSADARPKSPPLPAPTSLTATPGDEQVELTWTAVDGASTYSIYRNGDLVSNISDLTYTDRGRTNGIEYRYEVRAVDLVGFEGDPIERRATPRS